MRAITYFKPLTTTRFGSSWMRMEGLFLDSAHTNASSVLQNQLNQPIGKPDVKMSHEVIQNSLNTSHRDKTTNKNIDIEKGWLPIG